MGAALGLSLRGAMVAAVVVLVLCALGAALCTWRPPKALGCCRGFILGRGELPLPLLPNSTCSMTSVDVLFASWEHAARGGAPAISSGDDGARVVETGDGGSTATCGGLRITNEDTCPGRDRTSGDPHNELSILWAATSKVRRRRRPEWPG
jgi:hypothetical protein